MLRSSSPIGHTASVISLVCCRSQCRLVSNFFYYAKSVVRDIELNVRKSANPSRQTCPVGYQRPRNHTASALPSYTLMTMWFDPNDQTGCKWNCYVIEIPFILFQFPVFSISSQNYFGVVEAVGVVHFWVCPSGRKAQLNSITAEIKK